MRTISLNPVLETSGKDEAEISLAGARVKPGSDEQLGQIRGLILSALISSGLPYSELDDGVQASYLRIIEKRAGWRGEGKFTSWAYAVARSVGREMRRGRREIAVPLEDAARAADMGGLGCDTGPADEAVETGRRRFLARAMGGLPGDQAEVVGLFYYAGMKGEEIASALGLPLNTVKSKLLRARAALVQRAIDEGWRMQ